MEKRGRKKEKRRGGKLEQGRRLAKTGPVQNLGSGPTPVPVTVDGNTVDPVEEFTYLGSIQSSRSNSGPEYGTELVR